MSLRTRAHVICPVCGHKIDATQDIVLLQRALIRHVNHLDGVQKPSGETCDIAVMQAMEMKILIVEDPTLDLTPYV